MFVQKYISSDGCIFGNKMDDTIIHGAVAFPISDLRLNNSHM